MDSYAYLLTRTLGISSIAAVGIGMANLIDGSKAQYFVIAFVLILVLVGLIVRGCIRRFWERVDEYGKDDK